MDGGEKLARDPGEDQKLQGDGKDGKEPRKKRRGIQLSPEAQEKEVARRLQLKLDGLRDRGERPALRRVEGKSFIDPEIERCSKDDRDGDRQEYGEERQQLLAPGV